MADQNVTWKVVASAACGLIVLGMGFVASNLSEMGQAINELTAGNAATETAVAVLVTRMDGYEKAADALRVAVEASANGRYTITDAQRDFAAVQRQIDALSGRLEQHHDRLIILENRKP